MAFDHTHVPEESRDIPNPLGRLSLPLGRRFPFSRGLHCRQMKNPALILVGHRVLGTRIRAGKEVRCLLEDAKKLARLIHCGRDLTASGDNL